MDLNGGRSRALVVRGAAGHGKTALLDHVAAEAAEAGITVLRATGVASETAYAWSGVADLCRPIVSGLHDLPGPQAGALASALAMRPPADDQPFAVRLALLTLLANAGASRPVLAIVDDLQWIDAESAAALVFVARRLGAEGVGLVLAWRGDDRPTELRDLDEIVVGPLDDDEARAVLAEHPAGPFPRAVVERIVRDAGGNPLALHELPGLLSADERRGAVALHAPLAARGAAAIRPFEARIEALPTSVRAALTVAAAHGGGPLAPLLQALDALGLGANDLAAAEDADILQLDGDRLSFCHPLARAAAYASAPAAARRGAHAALAGVLDPASDLEAHARHLAMAAVGTDAAAADALDDAARHAASIAASATAYELLAWAARLSPSPDVRTERIIRAARHAVFAGHVAEADALLESLDQHALDPIARARRAQVRASTRLITGGAGRSMRELEAASQECAELDPDLAAELLVAAVTAGLLSGNHARAVALADMAATLPVTRDDTTALVRIAKGATLAAAGDTSAARPLVEERHALRTDAETASARLALILGAGSALIWLEDFIAAVELLDALVDSCRSTGATGLLPTVLNMRAWALLRMARVAEGDADARESATLARELGQTGPELQARTLAGQAAQVAGRLEQSRDDLLVVLDRLSRERLTPLRYNTTYLLAGTEIALGRHDAAIALLEEIVDPDSESPFFQNPAAFGAGLDLAECYIASGRVDDGLALVRRLEPVVERLTQRWPRGSLARVKAMVARDDGEASSLFAASIAELEPTPNAAIRTSLRWAQRLRRHGHDDDARRQIRDALRVARHNGIHGWDRLLADELAALGEPRVDSDTPPALPDDELAVATAVARGSTLDEVAEQLFISVPTAEDTLRRAARRLGATTVGSLRERLGLAVEHQPRVAGYGVEVLGWFSVRKDGQALTPPSGRPARLVQYLSVNGGHAPIDAVIEVLWPDVDPFVGRTRLRNVLARVRSAAGDLVVREGDVLHFEAGTEIDAHMFEREARRALAAHGADAVALATAALRWYRGPLLAHLPYEPWTMAPREALARRYLDLLDLLIADARTRDPAESVRLLELAIETEPFDEQRYLDAAEIRLEQGRPAAARSLVARARATCAELGVPAPHRLEALAQRVAQRA